MNYQNEIREGAHKRPDLEILINMISQRDSLISYPQTCAVWQVAMRRTMPLNRAEFEYFKRSWQVAMRMRS